MIFDKRTEYKNYLGISKELDIALKLMSEIDLSKAEPGRYEVCDGVFYNVFDASTRLYSEGKWEAHKDYIDIHLPITGAEKQGVCHIDELTQDGEYNADMDTCFYHNDTSKALYPVKPGEFLLVFPNDAHAPLIAVDDKPKEIRKLVFKVRF